RGGKLLGAEREGSLRSRLAGTRPAVAGSAPDVRDRQVREPRERDEAHAHRPAGPRPADALPDVPGVGIRQREILPGGEDVLIQIEHAEIDGEAVLGEEGAAV